MFVCRSVATLGSCDHVFVTNVVSFDMVDVVLFGRVRAVSAAARSWLHGVYSVLIGSSCMYFASWVETVQDWLAIGCHLVT